MSKRVKSTLLLIPFLLFYGLFLHGVQAANEKEEKSWQDETMYFIMVDRFNNGDSQNDKSINPSDPLAYHGGDLQGIIKRLDYIQDMGFTSIRLTPIVDNENGGYHGYWTKDFSRVDEHFGSLADMKELVQEAHKRNMKVIVDYAAAYTGANHSWLQDDQKRSWYKEEVKAAAADQTQPLPQLNTGNAEVQQFFIENAKWWLKETDLDGFALIGMEKLDADFVRTLLEELRVVKQDSFLIGVFEEALTDTAAYEAAGITSFVHASYNEKIVETYMLPGQAASSLHEAWKEQQAQLQNPYFSLHSLDDITSKRFTRIALEQKYYPPTRLRLALAYSFTSPGIPIMYYGTEIALDGGESPDNRRLMDFKTDDDFLKYITKLGELRQQLPALRRGTFELLYDTAGMSVWKRVYEKETIIIAINNTNETQKVHIPKEQLDTSKELRGLLEEDIVRPVENGYYLVLDRETANVYALAEKTGLNVTFISILVGIYVLFMLFLFLAWKRRKKVN